MLIKNKNFTLAASIRLDSVRRVLCAWNAMSAHMLGETSIRCGRSLHTHLANLDLPHMCQNNATDCGEIDFSAIALANTQVISECYDWRRVRH